VTDPDHILHWAAHYARQGWPMTVTHAKVPRFKGWQAQATIDLEQVEQWLRWYWPTDLSVVLPRDIVVVDIDGPEGWKNFKRLAKADPLTLDTLVARTQRGFHLWFNADGVAFKNHHIADDLETKCFGGHVVVPPCLGRVWVKDDCRSLMRAPAWLKRFGQISQKPNGDFRPPAAEPRVAREHTVQGVAALLSLCNLIRNAPKGFRDHARAKYAFTVGQYVGGGELEESDAWEAVRQAARDQIDGLGKEALRKETCLRESFANGIKCPRRCDDFGLGEIGRLEAQEGMSFEELSASVERQEP
jgi:hypothetical protein